MSEGQIVIRVLGFIISTLALATVAGTIGYLLNHDVGGYIGVAAAFLILGIALIVFSLEYFYNPSSRRGRGGR